MPSTFWQATLAEYVMAVEGYREAHRVGPVPMNKADYEALKKKHGYN